MLQGIPYIIKHIVTIHFEFFYTSMNLELDAIKKKKSLQHGGIETMGCIV